MKEQEIIEVLQWKLSECNLSEFSSTVCLIWDQFASSFINKKQAAFISEVLFIANKHPTRMFYLLDNILKILLTQEETQSYSNSLLVASNVYILVQARSGIIRLDEVFDTFSDNSSYLTDKSSNFNKIFRTFLKTNLGVELEELLPYVQYAS